MIRVKRGQIMENDLILEIDNVGPISHAKIDIGKINIIGGKNSTGKSTSSKLLYCFLRANYDHNEDLIVRAISPRLRRFASDLEKYEIIPDELQKPLYELGELSVDEIIEYYEELKLIYYKFEGDCVVKSHEDWIKTHSEDVDWDVDISESMALQFLRDKPRLERHIERIDEMVNVEKNPNELFRYLMSGLLSDEFDMRLGIFPRFGNKISFSSKNLNLNWKIDFKKDLCEKNGIFNIENIFYLDSFSIFDLPKNIRAMKRPYIKSFVTNTDHVRKLSENILDESEAEVYFDNIDNKEIIENEERVKNIIGGSIEIDKGRILYKTTDHSWHSMVNTASGIKQIGVVQKLLSNRKLKPQSFLIIDEPEVNLHPEWQVKFAEILVLLASELDINVYINTHSPMFIEAMSLYSEYYGLLDETYVYLSKDDKDYVPTEEIRFIYLDENNKKIKDPYIDNSPKFTFEKIDPKDMGAVYENLSRPYDDLDKLKSEILFKEE